jgi:hypothetical protein
MSFFLPLPQRALSEVLSEPVVRGAQKFPSGGSMKRPVRVI